MIVWDKGHKSSLERGGSIMVEVKGNFVTFTPPVDHRYGSTPEQGLWGASMGGLVSAWLAWRNPHLFPKVGCQSGCFTAHPEGGNEYHDPEWLTEQFAATPSLPVCFYLQTGQIEWLLAPNRRFAAVLADKGYFSIYEELPSGHNWATWEQGLEPGLIFLFGQEEKPSLFYSQIKGSVINQQPSKAKFTA